MCYSNSRKRHSTIYSQSASVAVKSLNAVILYEGKTPGSILRGVVTHMNALCYFFPYQQMRRKILTDALGTR